jgi:hypothetical protein
MGMNMASRIRANKAQITKKIITKLQDQYNSKPSNQLREKLFMDSRILGRRKLFPDPHFAYNPIVNGNDRLGSQTISARTSL